MSASKAAKKKGFKSLEEVAVQETRKRDTLSRWQKNAPELFDRWLEDAWQRKLKGEL